MKGVLVLLLAAVLGLFWSADRTAAATQAEGRVIIVQLVDISPTQFAFKPAQLEARRGDTIRFVQAGVMPHNVEFKKAPAGARLGAARMGPYVTAKGQAYELAIDERFVSGEYRFVCTPHEQMGMKGKLVVAD